VKNEALKARVAQAVVAQCEPHGQIEKRRTKYPLPNPLPRRGSVVTEKWDEGMTNK